MVIYRNGTCTPALTVTHPRTNLAQRRATSFIRRTTLATRPTPRRQLWCELQPSGNNLSSTSLSAVLWWACLWVCLSVSLREHISETTGLNCTKFLCKLPAAVAPFSYVALRYVMHFRFHWWRHMFSHSWSYGGMTLPLQRRRSIA